MLGYGKINGSITTENEARDFIAFMKSNVKIFEVQDAEDVKKGYEYSGFDLYKYYEIKILFVSDSLMITYFPKEVDEDIHENIRILHSANTLFIIIQRLQTYIYNCMNEKKILVRGGISNKFVLIDDQFAVGAGIIEAYLLESKKAIYPRIILSESICNNINLIKAVKYISLNIYNRSTFLGDDGDGILYLDYLRYNIAIALQGGLNEKTISTIDWFLRVHKETIEFHISTTSQSIDKIKAENKDNSERLRNLELVLDKYIWIKGYHNSRIREFKYDVLEQRFLIK